jgi:hypothetical protein
MQPELLMNGYIKLSFYGVNGIAFKERAPVDYTAA